MRGVAGQVVRDSRGPCAFSTAAWGRGRGSTAEIACFTCGVRFGAKKHRPVRARAREHHSRVFLPLPCHCLVLASRAQQPQKAARVFADSDSDSDCSPAAASGGRFWGGRSRGNQHGWRQQSKQPHPLFATACDTQGGRTPPHIVWEFWGFGTCTIGS